MRQGKRPFTLSHRRRRRTNGRTYGHSSPTECTVQHLLTRPMLGSTACDIQSCVCEITFLRYVNYLDNRRWNVVRTHQCCPHPVPHDTRADTSQKDSGMSISAYRETRCTVAPGSLTGILCTAARPTQTGESRYFSRTRTAPPF